MVNWVSHAMSAPLPVDIAKLKTEFHVRSKDGVLTCRWHREWGRVTPNAAGTTGWATVVRSQSPSVGEEEVIRIDCSKCFFKSVHDLAVRCWCGQFVSSCAPMGV